MAPLVVLLVSFFVLYLLNRFVFRMEWSLSFTGRLAMAIMLLFTAIAHFTHTDLMEAMVPRPIPFKRTLVYFSGIFEFLVGLGLLFRTSARISAGILILFLLAVIPANIKGSMESIPLGGMDKGPSYLFFRIPLQLFFILWVYFFGMYWNSHKPVND